MAYNNKDRKSNLWDNSKRRKKLNDGRKIRRTPAPRPIKKSSLAYNNRDRKSNLWDNSKRRKKLNDGRTIRSTPAPRPIKEFFGIELVTEQAISL